MAYKFSPNMASAEERRKTFVARQPILEDLLNRVKMDLGARHCILIGPRGIGKTHLLLLLADTIEADKELSAKWLVIRFAEEEYGISTLAEIFQRVVDKIPDIKPENLGRDADLALAYIQDYCEKEKKRILLLMDNIHLYFEQLNDVDIGKLRDILMSRAIFLIIGAAPSYFKQMVGYEEAFYNFFEPIHLGELKQEDAENLFLCRAEFDNNKEFADNFDQCRPKIATANRLTGGNPRLLLMLYKVMCESSFSDSTEAFKRLLDELTPFFQARMETLSAQERKVMDTLAYMEEPATPTELAKATGLSTGSISTPMRRLEDRGYIRKVKLKKSRGTRYEVTERLFRIWREMRSESGKTKFGFIIRFLDLWYSPKDILSESMRILSELPKVENIERQDLLLRLDYLKEASPEIMRMDLERIYSYAETNRLEMAESLIEPLKELAEYEDALKKDPDDISAWIGRVLTLVEQGRYQEALESANKAVELQRDKERAWLARGLALIGLDRYNEALIDLDKATQFKSDNAQAWYIRGRILGYLARYEEAFESFDKAIQLKPDYVEVWLYRGSALYKLSRYEEAFESSDRAIQLKPDYAEAWLSRGFTLLWRLGRHKEAFESFDKAIQLEPDGAMAWLNRGAALIILDKYEEASASFNKVIQLKPNFAGAWYGRGIALVRMGKHYEGLESIKKAEELAKEQGLEIIPQYSTVTLIETNLIDSLESLRENNTGLTNDYLMNALKSSEKANKNTLQQLIFAYIKSAIEIGKLEFAQSAIDKIASELGEDYNQLLQPFKIAIEYMQTGDVEILERLQQEEREIVQEIVKLRDSKQA